MPRTPEETRALFDRWACTYETDLLRSGKERPDPLTGYHESLREAASLLSVNAETTVLDVGIGTGAPSTWPSPASPFTRFRLMTG